MAAAHPCRPVERMHRHQHRLDPRGLASVEHSLQRPMKRRVGYAPDPLRLRLSPDPLVAGDVGLALTPPGSGPARHGRGCSRSPADRRGHQWRVEHPTPSSSATAIALGSQATWPPPVRRQAKVTSGWGSGSRHGRRPARKRRIAPGKQHQHWRNDARLVVRAGLVAHHTDPCGRAGLKSPPCCSRRTRLPYGSLTSS